MAKTKRKPGRPKKAKTIETEWQVKLPTLERRCRQFRMTETIENLRKADKFGGTEWGAAYLRGLITRKQFEAADEFALLRRRYILALGAPPETPAGASDMAVDGRGHKTLTDYGQTDIATYNALVALMGGPEEMNVIWFNVGEPYVLGRVRDGLDRAAEFFQIEVAA